MADFTALKTSIQNYIKQNGNEEITGNLLQQILLSMVNTLGDSAINDLVTALNAEIANRGNADTELGGRITSEAEARAGADNTLRGLFDGITANIENGYVYAGIATPSTTPASGKVFYLALTAGTYTNFGATVVPQGINVLKYNGSAWSLDSFLGLDDAPTAGSGNFVKSGGVDYAEILNEQLTRVADCNNTKKKIIISRVLPILYNESTIVQDASSLYGGIIIPVKEGEVYNLDNYTSIVFTSTIPAVGVSIIGSPVRGENLVTIPSSVNYMFITVAKSNLPLNIHTIYTIDKSTRILSVDSKVFNNDIYKTTLQAILAVFCKVETSEKYYIGILSGRTDSDCRLMIYDDNDNIVEDFPFTKDGTVKTFSGSPFDFVIDTSKVYIQSGSFYGFGKNLVIDTSVLYSNNIYYNTNYVFKGASNATRFSLTTGIIKDRSKTKTVVFNANTEFSGIPEYKVYFVDSKGENNTMDAGTTFGFGTYNTLQIPSGYDKIQFFYGTYYDPSFIVNVVVYNADSILLKTDRSKEELDKNFDVVYEKRAIGGVNSRFGSSIKLKEGGRYWLSIKKNSADVDSYIVYFLDSTDPSHPLLVARGYHFEQEYEFTIPTGYDGFFIFSDYNTETGYDITIKVAEYYDLTSRVNAIEERQGLNKTILCFGDSITELVNGQTFKGYPDYLRENYGYNVIKAGSGGARIAQRSTPVLSPANMNEAYAAFDICNIVKAWCEDDWSYIDPARVVLEAGGDDCSFIDKLKTINPLDVDIVTIFGGTNDFTGNSVIGTESSSDNGTIYGALNNILSYLTTANPRLKIYFFTPIVRYFENIRDNAHWSDNFVSTASNMSGKKLPDIASLIYEHITKKHIPCDNWYWTLGWNQLNFSTFFSDGDGTHPYNGFEWMAEKMKNYIISH